MGVPLKRLHPHLDSASIAPLFGRAPSRNAEAMASPAAATACRRRASVGFKNASGFGCLQVMCLKNADESVCCFFRFFSFSLYHQKPATATDKKRRQLGYLGGALCFPLRECWQRRWLRFLLVNLVIVPLHNHRYMLFGFVLLPQDHFDGKDNVFVFFFWASPVRK